MFSFLRLAVICFCLIIAVLSGCTGVPQETPVVQSNVPLSTPTTVASPSPEPTPTPQVDLPAATAAPAEAPLSDSSEPTQKEAASTTGNPDLDFAQVTFVRATQSGDGSWRFDATVRHNDEGWDHYADAWQVVDMDKNLLGERILLHPHDTEQPFTRSETGIEIPEGITQVIVRAKCNVHGFGGQEILIDLTASEGENYEVVHS